MRSRFRMSCVLFRFTRRARSGVPRERERKGEKEREGEKRERGLMRAPGEGRSKERRRGWARSAVLSTVALHFFSALVLRPEDKKMKLLCLAARERERCFATGAIVRAECISRAPERFSLLGNDGRGVWGPSMAIHEMASDAVLRQLHGNRELSCVSSEMLAPSRSSISDKGTCENDPCIF